MNKVSSGDDYWGPHRFTAAAAQLHTKDEIMPRESFSSYAYVPPQATLDGIMPPEFSKVMCSAVIMTGLAPISRPKCWVFH